MKANERKPLFWPEYQTAESDTFTVENGQQVTVVAMGLENSDEVTFEIVFAPAIQPDLCACPPGVVKLPSVAATAPLMCCGEEVTLSATNPYVVIDAPQNILLRAVLTASDPSNIWVWALDTNTPYVTDRQRGCSCANEL